MIISTVMKMKKNDRQDHDELESIIQDLTQIIENEVKAFQSLISILNNQQNLYAADVVNEKVNKIVAETKKLEKKRDGKSKDISRCLDAGEPLALCQLIPLVEKRYVDRLEELKKILHVLSDKLENSRQEKRDYLEHSLEFVNRSLENIVGYAG